MDIDETIDVMKGFGSKKRRNFFKKLDEKAQRHVQNILTTLQDGLSSYKANIFVDPKTPSNIIFEYPKALDLNLYGEGSNYLKPRILLEFGAKGDISQSNNEELNTYIEEVFENKFYTYNIKVNALSPIKTFWEKITLLHMLANKEPNPLGDHMARHYYDVYMMMGNSKMYLDAKNNLQLLSEVADYKSVYFRDKNAVYERAITGELMLIPKNPMLTKLEKDYIAMEEFFFKEPPQFSKIITQLTKLENEINKTTTI